VAVANAIELTPDTYDACRWEDCIHQILGTLVRAL